MFCVIHHLRSDCESLTVFQNIFCRSDLAFPYHFHMRSTRLVLHHPIQSAPFSCKKLLILSCFISLNLCCISFLAPTKFVQLPNHTEESTITLKFWSFLLLPDVWTYLHHNMWMELLQCIFPVVDLPSFVSHFSLYITAYKTYHTYLQWMDTCVSL